MAEHNILGKKGEELAAKFLENLGYQIIAVNWHEKKFEIGTLPLILFSTFAGSTLFLYIFDTNIFLLPSLISTAFAAILFLLLRILHPRKEKRFI